MATRFYYSRLVAPISPSFDSSWELTGAPTRYALATFLDIDPNWWLGTFGYQTTSNSPAGAVDGAIAQYISAPLNGDQTISGDIKGQIRAIESNVAADARAQMVIRVVSNDGSTVRGTLIASDTGALTSEWATGTAANREFPRNSPVTPSSVNALDGDRIVVEVGFRKHENATTNREFLMYLGANGNVSDLPEDESSTSSLNPWVEFADTLSFDSPDIRVTKVGRYAGLIISAPDIRVTKVSRYAAIVNPVAATPPRLRGHRIIGD